MRTENVKKKDDSQLADDDVVTVGTFTSPWTGADSLGQACQLKICSTGINL